HDILHAVLDALDEAGAGLWKMVLSRCTSSARLIGTPMPVPLLAALANSVLVVESDVEPDRRVEGTVLVKAEPGEVVVKGFRAGGVPQVAVFETPVGDGAGDPVDELPDRVLSAPRPWIGAEPRIAIEVFRNHDLGREFAPVFGHFDSLLTENNLAFV